jgi:hypothetical protein
VVYKAEDLKLERTVALKFLSADQLSSANVRVAPMRPQHAADAEMGVPAIGSRRAGGFAHRVPTGCIARRVGAAGPERIAPMPRGGPLPSPARYTGPPTGRTP